MIDEGVSASIRRASPHDSLDHLIESAYARATAVRGGRALVEQLWGEESDVESTRAAIYQAVEEQRVWVGIVSEDIVAGALVSGRCVQAVWVEHAHRRRGIATSLLRELLKGEDPPSDAWALPGDRSTKSLYESVGWKARLLTMRGA